VETVIPGVTGWLVEPGNVEAMTKALEEALTLPADERAAAKPSLWDMPALILL